MFIVIGVLFLAVGIGVTVCTWRNLSLALGQYLFCFRKTHWKWNFSFSMKMHVVMSLLHFQVSDHYFGMTWTKHDFKFFSVSLKADARTVPIKKLLVAFLLFSLQNSHDNPRVSFRHNEAGAIHCSCVCLALLQTVFHHFISKHNYVKWNQIFCGSITPTSDGCDSHSFHANRLAVISTRSHMYLVSHNAW